MVLDTCKVTMRMHQEFRKNFVTQVANFIAGPEHRSADVVPSIHIFIAQLYTILQIEKVKVGEELQAPITLSNDELKLIFRFAFEEEMRRNLAKAGKDPLKEDEICELLFPDFKAFAD